MRFRPWTFRLPTPTCSTSLISERPRGSTTKVTDPRLFATSSSTRQPLAVVQITQGREVHREAGLMTPFHSRYRLAAIRFVPYLPGGAKGPSGSGRGTGRSDPSLALWCEAPMCIAEPCMRWESCTCYEVQRAPAQTVLAGTEGGRPSEARGPIR